MTGYISPVGYVDLDNDCDYALDVKSTRSRESVDTKTDLAFYFNTYITPKYGLENINVSNCASFMKDLEMNWSKLTPSLKDKVLDIMVDYILKEGDYDFKKRLLHKLGIHEPKVTEPESKSNFGKDSKGPHRDHHDNTLLYIAIAVVLLGLTIFMIDSLQKNKVGGFNKFV